jgi:membrane-bound lytic murein transglycosylase D
VPRLKPVFASERVPGELVWLAEVESSFDANARSPAGAAGLFQLMPPTAQRMGLAMRPTDQRFNAEKSARASAKYLRTLHTEFRDWPLTLAAYNAGEGKVRRLLANQRVKTFDQIASSLPAETQMYVPKVEAVIQRREGKALAAL